MELGKSRGPRTWLSDLCRRHGQPLGLVWLSILLWYRRQRGDAAGHQHLPGVGKPLRLLGSLRRCRAQRFSSLVGGGGVWWRRLAAKSRHCALCAFGGLTRSIWSL